MKLMRPRTTRIQSHPYAEPVACTTSIGKAVFAAIRTVTCLTSRGQSQASISISNQTRTRSRNRFPIIADSRMMTVAPDGIEVGDGRLYDFQNSVKHNQMTHRVITNKRIADRARRDNFQ